jgi:hypothetical protein
LVHLIKGYMRYKISISKVIPVPGATMFYICYVSLLVLFAGSISTEVQNICPVGQARSVNVAAAAKYRNISAPHV